MQASSTYRCIKLDAVWEVCRRWELCPDSNGTTEDKGLTHSDASSSRVVKWHGAVDDVIPPKAAEVVHAWGHEYHPEMSMVLKRKYRVYENFIEKLPASLVSYPDKE